MLLPGHQSFADKRVENKDNCSLQTNSRKQGQHSFKSNGKIGTNGRNKDGTPSRRIEENKDSSPLQTKVKRETAVLCKQIAGNKDSSPLQTKAETRTSAFANGNRKQNRSSKKAVDKDAVLCR